MSDSLVRLKAILAEVTDLSRAAALLEWDQETYMPSGGVAARSDQLSTLLRLSHVRFTADEVGHLLSELEDETSGQPFDSYEASLIRVTRRDYEQERKLPPDLVAEAARASSAARPLWEKARREGDFKIFAPALEKNVELNRQIADALGYAQRPYDALLDRNEPGLTTDQLETIFAELKRAIVPLVADIARHADAVDDRVIYRGFDPAAQLRYALDLVATLGYDLERGRQDISTHPFSTSFGPGDVRITTRVSRDFFNECLFGSIHESGHAMYNQGIGDDIDRTPLWGGASPGVHESQSRLWENLVGRSHPFWKHFFPSLQKAFPEQLRGVDDEAFFKAVNKSYPSLIRVEADEVTYNLHVLLRFELENEMLEGKLKVKDLPEAWNSRINSYLGINVPNDREGALQDIHWSYVGFGVFPGYTLGNLIGAQLMEKIRTEIKDLDSQIEAGQFTSLLGWLRLNVHRHGRKFTPNELLERATGKPLEAGPWIGYVREKFGSLYGIKPARV
ncbi:MAG TPA: carboxypeptidase M32 [Candidatus Acidoferrum sp.]|nr:carboxypeptidase M32 [Candidatus Angelobacter sp.]HXD80502.1 carboxypeptidase M32 [Candidatus Acidoferrum sp.]